MSLTLEVFRCLLVTYLAARRWTIFELLYVGLCVWIPDGADIFHQRTDKGKIGLLFDGDTSDTEVSPEKTDGLVCFVTYALDVGVPA